MTVSVKVLIPGKVLENSQTTQYTSPTGTNTIIDKFTVTNHGASPVTISVNLATVGSLFGNANLIVDTKTISVGETYTFPEIVGYVLGPGDYISTIAGALNSLNLRCSGREVT